MNALNLATLLELERQLAEISRNDEIRVVVLTGGGAAFCAGADLKEVLAAARLGPGKSDFLNRPMSCSVCCVTFQNRSVRPSTG